MKMLSSKEFTLDDISLIPDWVKERIDVIRADNENLPVTITIMAKGRGRKQTAKRQLEAMALDAFLEKKSIWANCSYHFDFLNHKYFWDKKEIHITANEELYLFHRLVSNDEIHKLQSHFIHDIRKRLGKNFLKELENDGQS
jgi:hypothetical protein